MVSSASKRALLCVLTSDRKLQLLEKVVGSCRLCPGHIANPPTTKRAASLLRDHKLSMPQVGHTLIISA